MNKKEFTHEDFIALLKKGYKYYIKEEISGNQEKEAQFNLLFFKDIGEWLACYARMDEEKCYHSEFDEDLYDISRGVDLCKFYFDPNVQ
jgi:hypothetical protein